MTTNSLLSVTVTALVFTAACKSDFQAGINGNDGSAQEVAVLHDSGSPAGSIPWSCDPFNPTTKPITFVTVLGAGRDTDGTLYVVDQPQADSEQRVFVSSGGTLQRQRVAGSPAKPARLGRTGRCGSTEQPSSACSLPKARALPRTNNRVAPPSGSALGPA